MNKLYFRAWLPNENEMVEVINIVSLNSSEITAIGYYDEDDEYSEYMLSECHLMQGIEIDEGRVIYEGDIVKYSTSWYEDYPTYRVEFHEGSFYFDTDGYTCIPINSMSDLNELEVIGNIYEKEMGK